MVPSLLINSSTMVICLYDCTSDILLLTVLVQLVDLDETPPKISYMVVVVNDSSQVIAYSYIYLVAILLHFIS